MQTITVSASISEPSEHASAVEPRIGRSVSIDHAAILLGVSRRTVYNRISDGQLKTVRTLGVSQRVLIDSLQVFVLSGHKPPAAPLAAHEATP